MRSSIQWVCEAPEHRALPSSHGNGGVTAHAGAWAYCDGAGAVDGHRWVATGGVPLETLVRWTAPNGHPKELAKEVVARSAATTRKLTKRPAGARQT
jgi:hypothetical protein